MEASFARNLICSSSFFSGSFFVCAREILTAAYSAARVQVIGIFSLPKKPLRILPNLKGGQKYFQARIRFFAFAQPLLIYRILRCHLEYFACKCDSFDDAGQARAGATSKKIPQGFLLAGVSLLRCAHCAAFNGGSFFARTQPQVRQTKVLPPIRPAPELCRKCTARPLP